MRIRNTGTNISPSTWTLSLAKGVKKFFAVQKWTVSKTKYMLKREMRETGIRFNLEKFGSGLVPDPIGYGYLNRAGYPEYDIRKSTRKPSSVEPGVQYSRTRRLVGVRVAWVLPHRQSFKQIYDQLQLGDNRANKESVAYTALLTHQTALGAWEGWNSVDLGISCLL